MSKKSGNQTDTLLKLREEAERLMSINNWNEEVVPSKKVINALLHEVQVQQIELEMQNDELKISNEELELQRAKFAGLYDLAPVGYFILNHFGIIEEVNDTGVKLLESAKHHIINKRFQNFLTPEEGEVFSRFLQSIRVVQSRQSCQLTMLKPGGKKIYVQIEGIIILQAIKESVRCYIAVIDITDRKNAENRILETNQRLEMALNASSAGTWEIDLTSGRIFLDNFSKGIFGFKKGDFDGRSESFLAIIHPDDRKMVERELQAAILQGKELDIQYRIARPDKRVTYIGVRGHVVTDQNGQSCFVGIIVDINERKQLEKTAIQLKIDHDKNILAASLQAQENERKRISEALHDSVGQLLYGIKLSLDHEKSTVNNGKHILQLLNQAINETRNISFELAPSILKDFGLATTLNEMAKRLSTPYLSISVTADGLKTRLELAKEVNIFRIIQELVNNCIKHADGTAINILIKKNNNKILIEVSDNGKGFAYDEHSTVFTGTGLAGIRNRLSLYNGIMQVESTPATGTKISITLKED